MVIYIQTLTMQSTIRSFFQPLARKKVEEKSEENNHVKDNLSPQKKPVNSGQLVNSSALCTENSTEKVDSCYDEVTPCKVERNDIKADDTKQQPVDAPEQNDPREKDFSTTSPAASNSPSPTSIPKRKTARKQIPKRKAEEEVNSCGSSQEVISAKRQKGEDDGEGLKEESDERPMELEELKDEKDTHSESLENKTKIKAEDDTMLRLHKPSSKPITTFFGLKDDPDEKPIKLEELKVEKPIKLEELKDENDTNSEYKMETSAEEEKKLNKLPSKPFSSFFAPRKASVKTKEEQTPVLEENKSLNSCIKINNRKPNSLAGDSLKPSLKVEPVEYNPAKNNYHPINDACWSPKERVPYLAVARTFERIEEESARLKIIEILSNLFRSVIVLSSEDLVPCVYLCLNQLGPAYEGLELGIGKTILMKALAQATGRQLDQIKAEAAEKGDLGLVAESSRTTQGIMSAPPRLRAGVVFGKLQAIGRMTGNSSMNKKIDIIKSLFVACRHSEARYIARSLEGKLRIGLAEQSVLSALAQAASLTPPGQPFPPEILDASKGKSAEARKAWLDKRVLIVKQAFCELPSYNTIVPVLLEHGVESLPQHCQITPGIPLKPMLAYPTKGIGEILKRFEEAAFTCEYKYDGERAQIHILENGEVHIYSRNQENNTTKYPDILVRIPKMKKATVESCILDAEVVAWDPDSKQIQPFQVLTTRKRKDVDAADIRVQVCVYAFDMLYLNGESLVRKPLSQRRVFLRDSFTEVEGQFLFATFMDTNNTDEIAEFLERSIKDSCEGLMVKTLEVDATYEIAKRSHNWLKLKKDYLEGVGDTLDLVVIGAYLGMGKRTGTYGGFLLACYDKESEEFQSICKIGTGFSDVDLEKLHTTLKDLVIPQPRSYYRWGGTVEPDHWLEAQHVWEVKCADLSLSPAYRAATGLVDEDKGISLRFPRFLHIRDDKKPEDATSSTQVAELYRKQQQIQNQPPTEKGDDDFY